MKFVKVCCILLYSYTYATSGTFNQVQVHDNYWRVCSNLTEGEIQRQLFGATNSITAFSYLTSEGSLLPVLACTDPAWNRVVYSIFGNIWIHGEYGHQHAAQYDFPSGICSTPERLIFVADRFNNEIHVLYFNHESLPAVGFFGSGSQPVDVCYDDGGTAAFGDDFFWVAHCGDGTVKKYGYTFDPVYLTFDYTLDATISGLEAPISVARGRESGTVCENCDPYGHNEWLYVLEASGTIRCYTNNQVPPGNDPNIIYHFSYQPPEDVQLSSIAVDHEGIIWATDGYNSQLLTYYNNESCLLETDRIGQFGMDNVPGEFAVPCDISFMEAVHQNIYDPNILEVHVDPAMFIQEIWSSTSGGVRGYRGIGIRDLAARWVYPRDYENRPVELSYFTTGISANSINIFNSSDVNIRTIVRSDVPGQVSLIWDGKDNGGSQAPVDLYTIELRGSEVTFNTNSPPVIDYAYFDPMGCFDEDDISRPVQALVSDPDGETWFQYQWNVERGYIQREGIPCQYCQELIYQDDGNSRIIFYPPGMWLTNPKDIPISLTVSDQTSNPTIAYSDATTFYARQCGEECPFLYSLNGPDTLRQNNILNASIDTSGGGNLVFDYMLLQGDIEPNSGKYNFFIREDEDADDSLDWSSLVTVDHNAGTDLLISKGGSLYEELITVPPSSATDDLGNDVLDELRYADEVYYTRDDSGWLDITYEGLDTFNLSLDDPPSGTVPGDPHKTPTGMATGKPHPNILTVSVKDSNGDWQEVERIFARKKSQPSFVDLSDFFAPIVEVRYKWSVRYQVDFISYDWVKPITDGIRLLEPSSAYLNDSLDVLNLIRKVNNHFAGFTSNEFISLEFPYYDVPVDKERDFIFLCRGKYNSADSLAPPKPEPDLPLPTELALNQNYPNPFNSTTIIRYANPTTQFVCIKIYNILGQEVTTPLSEVKDAGYYQIIWDGKNAAGESVSSGIYFYRLFTTEKEIRKKMLLLK